MVARVWSVAFSGVKTLPVEVQVSLVSGLPAFVVVGLPDKAVGESRERVRAAFQASGVKLPPKRIVANLAPADLNKEGSHFDLPIALALLGAIGVLDPSQLEGIVALGELGLDGRVASVPGILPAAFHCRDTRRRLVCPAAQGAEASQAKGVEWLGAPSLAALVESLVRGDSPDAPPDLPRFRLGDGIRASDLNPPPSRDLSEVKGQELSRRALEAAAAGAHNILLTGPPGAGKSLLAQCLPGILPPLEAEEANRVSAIWSLAGILPQGGIVTARPFRAPHHSASLAALTGGGTRARPGEVSLAHRGVLFLDELPEFSRSALESLRQPLESGIVSVARAAAHHEYPARFQLVAAMNPCRCGELGIPGRGCGRAPKCGQEYRAKISGPLLDRIDIRIETTAVPPHHLAAMQGGEPSAAVRARVVAARAIQTARASETGVATNAELEGKALEGICDPGAEGIKVLTRAAETFRLSARGWNRVLRLARTLADLEARDAVNSHDILEALSWRREPGSADDAMMQRLQTEYENIRNRPPTSSVSPVSRKLARNKSESPSAPRQPEPPKPAPPPRKPTRDIPAPKPVPATDSDSLF